MKDDDIVFCPTFKYTIIRIILWVPILTFGIIFSKKSYYIYELYTIIVLFLTIICIDIIQLQKIFIKKESICIKRFFFGSENEIRFDKILEVNKIDTPIYSSMSHLCLVTEKKKAKVYYNHIKGHDKLEDEIRARCARARVKFTGEARENENG